MFLTLVAQAGEKSQNPAGSIVLLLPLVLLFYFFMIRPQRRARESQAELMRALQVGDEVETIAGMFGTVRRLSDDMAWVEFAPGTTVKVARRAIRRRIVEEKESEAEGGA